MRAPDYDPLIFVQRTKSVKRIKIREKLENTSMQHESQIAFKDEDETQSPQTTQQASKKQ